MNADILGLRNWRKGKGITLDAIASSTKLSIRQLQAIESGDFRLLPGGIYNTSYIRQYAEAIGYDEADLLAFYAAACSTSSVPEAVAASHWWRWPAALSFRY